MDRLAYLAMTGATQALKAQQNTSNNLANANTPGFRADLESLTSQPVYGPGYASRVYSTDAGEGADFKQGAVMDTGRSLDVAVKGSGWIAVQAPDGTEAYTRRGDLQISNGGILQNGAGEPVMGNSGPIAIPPAQKLEIGSDGTISIVPAGQAANTLAVVDRIKLVNPPSQNLVKGRDGLFRLRDGTQAAPDASVQVASGALEGSNVNTVDALVQLIDHARNFEANIKLLRTAKEDDQASQRLMRTSG